jgi:NitT/TauT family transport system permease protein
MSDPKVSGVAATSYGELPVFGVTAVPAQQTRRLAGYLVGKEGWCLFSGLLFLWQVVAWVVPASNRFLFPSPLVTFRALWVSLPELGRGTVSSFIILIPGYTTAVVAGVVLGILAGTTRWLERLTVPFARVVAPVPPTVYVPYAIALLPGFRSAAIAVVFIGAFWPVFVNSMAGAASVPQRLRDNARVLGLRKVEYLRRVVFPSSLTHIFSGMSVGLAMSFIMLTVAELFGANAGLGRFVQFYADYADYPRMVAGILFTGVVTFVCMRALDRLKRRALFWQR